MSVMSGYQELLAQIDAINDYGAVVTCPGSGAREMQQLADSVNQMVERLKHHFMTSDEASDSLAAASVRMVLLFDLRDRLNRVDKLVHSHKELPLFMREVLIGLLEVLDARAALYWSMNDQGGLSGLLSRGMTEDQRQSLRDSPGFRSLVAEIGQQTAIRNRSQVEIGLPGLCDKILATPLRVGDHSYGVVLLMRDADAPSFNRDEESMLEHVVPVILHVLERLEFVSALTITNQNLRDAQTKQAALIAELESAQAKLLQSEKMASVGQLAAGVAHEINNPIGYVYSNLNTLEKYVGDLVRLLDVCASDDADDPGLRQQRIAELRQEVDLVYLREDLHDLIAESREGITRVKKIVQDLKDFSHVDREDAWLSADLRAGMESTLNIVNNEIKYKAEVIREYQDIPPVECIISQLNQVFMNLLVNAAHAIEEQGTIHVRMRNSDADEVCIEVADTGMGIPAENMSRIFDPFFTTKPIGKGTGLGLSLAYGIIQKHHGRIEVDSAPGLGTTFRIYLPVHQPADAGENA